MDAAFTEIMRNRFSAIAEEASTVAYRTAHTTFVKQTQDFQVALARPSGEFFAFPTMTGVTSGVCQSVDGLVGTFAGDLVPGDVIISNDPHRTNGLVTHTMDIHLARPIFHEGELVCFAWAFVHASDIGGAVPGSIAPNLTEVFQEGIQIRPMKIRRAGQLNHDVVHLLQDNSRIGSEIWGDLEAMQAAMHLLDRRVGEMCAKVGLARFREAIDAVMDYAELKARSVISNLRDGTYHFSDYLEGQAPGEAIHICCRLTIDGSNAEIDYSGSDPQVHSAMNFATGDRSHPFLCLALTNYINTVEPSTPVNGGIIRPIRAVAPRGTIMNANFPAAMGNRWVAAMRVYDALMGCLNQAIPGGIAACGAGQAGIISASWVDEMSGQVKVAVVEPFSGGSGARVKMDGVDANDTMVGYLKSTPIENVEIDIPLIVRRHELVPDSFGHGRFRGGAAVCIELEAVASEVMITVRGLDRFHIQPWGVFGGAAGSHGKTRHVTEKGEDSLGRFNLVTLRRGERLRLVSPGGGGFGDALQRDPARVAADVRRGLLDAAVARDVYGVVLADGTVDRQATETERASRKPRAPATAAPDDIGFDLGPARIAYEKHYPPELSAALANALLKEPQGVRRWIRAQVNDHLAAGTISRDPEAMAKAVRELVRAEMRP